MATKKNNEKTKESNTTAKSSNLTPEAKKILAVFDSVSSKRKSNPLQLCTDVQDWEIVPTGDIELDLMLGGGFAMGRMYSIESLFSGGKSTLILETIGKVLKRYPNKFGYLGDVEGTLDKEYAEHIIGDPWREGRVILDTTISGQEIVNTLMDLMATDSLAIACIDSWAAIETPTEEKKEDIGDQSVGALARFGSDVLKYLKNEASYRNTLFLLANQLRVNITPMGARGEIPCGGKAPVFYPDVRINLQKPDPKKDGRIATIVKSKTAAQFMATGAFSVTHDYGLDRVKSLINYLTRVKSDWLYASGAWFSIVDPETGEPLLKVQGDANFTEALRGNKEILTKLTEAHDLPEIEVRDFLKRKQKINPNVTTVIGHEVEEPDADN